MKFVQLIPVSGFLVSAILTGCNSNDSQSSAPLNVIQSPNNSAEVASSATPVRSPAPTATPVSPVSTPVPVITPAPTPVVINTPVPAQPLVLIYKGPGSCSADQGDAGDSGYGCSEAAADAATLAGFRFQYVGPKDSPDFSKAKVWIQPGGVSNTAYYAMTSKLRSSLIQFVKNGGGYVGFCAGAFLATDWFEIIDSSSEGLDYNSARGDVGYAFLPVNWLGQKRTIYFEGGPYFYNSGSSVEIVSKFSSGYAQAIRSTYGKGRVYISGGHPESPAIWSGEDGIRDPDGSDLDIAASMIEWSSAL